MDTMIQAVIAKKPNAFKELVQAGLKERLTAKMGELQTSIGNNLFSNQPDITS
jgi:hypothetical protein